MHSDNIIATQTHHNVITGGETNSINPGAVRSFIGGGICNTITGQCAVIAGGCNNTVSGGFSAILGGANNNDGGFPFSGIYGNGITAVAADMFHVSCLNAVNTPTVPGAFHPSGTIVRWDPALGPLPAGLLPLYMVP